MASISVASSMSTADRLAPFGVTIFTEMTALASEHDAINLGQGFPNWEGAGFVKEAAIRSMAGGDNDQYPPSPGVPALRQAIAERYGPLLGRELDPDAEITVTSGCTEAVAASFLGLINPGDEIVLIEPFYDSYPACASLAGAVPKFVQLQAPEFRLDPDELRAVFSDRTKAIVFNTPHNPTGRMFDSDELQMVADLCQEFDAIVIADEVYEEITFGKPHLRIATLTGMWERTLTLSSLGKTFSLTGWKLGWAIGPPALTAGLRSAHQFLTFTTPTPVQHGGVAALQAPPDFFDDLRSSYRSKRDTLARGLTDVGFEVHLPEGTYFLMAGFESFGFDDDRKFARHMVAQAGVVAIPPSVFYNNPADGRHLIRFAFCKDEATLDEAVARLGSLRSAR
jgi:L-glutamine---4-(methylsulfanyl)-2-oxobutanoate aminotransferase